MQHNHGACIGAVCSASPLIGSVNLQAVRAIVVPVVVPGGGARGLMMKALSKQMPWLEDSAVSASGLPALRRGGPVSSEGIRFDKAYISST